jgi:hypothetical protein
MKKITLIVVSLLVTLFSYSQDFSRVVRASKLIFKDSTWVTVETQYPTDMFVILKDWDVNIAEYKLKTYDQPEKKTYLDHITYTWKCVNSEGEKCLFMMKKFDPSVSKHVVFSVLYEQYLKMYEYETE